MNKSKIRLFFRNKLSLVTCTEPLYWCLENYTLYWNDTEIIMNEFDIIIKYE